MDRRAHSMDACGSEWAFGGHETLRTTGLVAVIPRTATRVGVAGWAALIAAGCCADRWCGARLPSPVSRLPSACLPVCLFAPRRRPPALLYWLSVITQRHGKRHAE